MGFDSLGDRMKNYENAYRLYLPRRLPVIIRVDGRAFHTFTKGFQKPFDDVFARAMRETALILCKEISGAKMAYVQSDEISVLVTNNDTIDTQPWFDNNLQKLVSLSSSIATFSFIKAFQNAFNEWGRENLPDWDEGGTNEYVDPMFLERTRIYNHACQSGAAFDARAFILPPDEVCNYFIWRQQDATRNSIQMVAQSLYSHKELQGKNCDELQEMIFQKGINWNNYQPWQKHGICLIKETVNNDSENARRIWKPDYDTPIFTQDRNYIERRLIPHDD